MQSLVPAKVPTFYFIGVTTQSSSIMRVFPKWAEALGLEAEMKGIDLPLHAPAEEYRKVTEFLKNDPLSLGALVTTHKLDLYKACKDMFDYIDPFAEQLEEVSCLSKLDGKFRAHAKDPISSGLALEAFVPENFWKEHDGEVLLMGAGGSSLAMTMYFTQEKFKGNMPKRITIANRSQPRLDSAREVLSDCAKQTEVRYVLGPTPADNDALVAALPPYSLVINATGLGKDAPGSPTTDAVSYPENTLVWEINYRGNLIFKDQAEAQAKEKNLHVEDGWIYFIHGWTQVIEEVFHIKLDAETLNRLSEIAKQTKPERKEKKNDWEKGFVLDFSLIDGLSKGAKSTKRLLSQMQDMYADTDAAHAMVENGDPVVYEFYELGTPETAGDLAFGTSICYPGKVGNEYFMTKGHFHTILDTAEVYYTLSGKGYMLTESPEGDVQVHALEPGKAVYVPKRYAHRSVNTGDTPLITFYVFRGDAGHDYGTIETKGYRKLIVEGADGKPEVVDNPKWKK